MNKRPLSEGLVLPHGASPSTNWWRLDAASLEITPKYDVVQCVVKNGLIVAIEYEYRSKSGEVKRRWVRANTSSIEYHPTFEMAAQRKEEIVKGRKRLSLAMAKGRYDAAVASREKTIRGCDKRVEDAREEMRLKAKDFIESYGVACFGPDDEMEVR